VCVWSIQFNYLIRGDRNLHATPRSAVHPLTPPLPMGCSFLPAHNFCTFWHFGTHFWPSSLKPINFNGKKCISRCDQRALGGARFHVCHFNEWACIISIPKWLQGHFPHKFAFAYRFLSSFQSAICILRG